MDQIFIKDLAVRGIIGVYEHERHKPQDILINITLFTDTRRAAKTDSIKDCEDYDALAQKVRAYVESSARFTVEALAEDIANLCLETSGGLHVRVRVDKPEAIKFVVSVGVEIERHRIKKPT